jgi:hypothetical protein
MHCVSHRFELAVKDSLVNKSLNPTTWEVREFLISLYYIFKKSPKLSRHLKATGEASNAQVYKLKKVHGTRFIGHLRLGLRCLLNDWVVLVQALEHSIAQKKMSAKLPGILRKMKDCGFLAGCCILMKLLDTITPLSLAFERGSIMSHEVDLHITRTLSGLKSLEEQEHSLQETLSIAGFQLHGSTLMQKVMKMGDSRKNPGNRETVEVQCEGIQGEAKASKVISSFCKNVPPAVSTCLQTRFATFEEEIFQNMRWIDPSLWHEDPKEDVPQLQALEENLKKRNHANDAHYAIQKTALEREWRDFRLLYNKCYGNFKTLPLWKKIFNYRRAEFPNVCKLAEFVFSVGPSNAAVEAGFSHLTAMLNDRRLSLSHNTMENLLLLKVNHLVLNQEEREQILQKAVEKFLKPGQKRKLKMDESECGSKSQRMRIEMDDHDEPEAEEMLEVIMEDDDEDAEEGTEDDFEDFSECSDVEIMQCN